MRDYWGYGKASSKPGARPLLPMIGVPTTAGTGSDAQSYALISDAETHVKMACGDPQAAFKVAILDPAPDRDRAAGVDRGHGIRRHLTRGRKLRHEKTQPAFAHSSRARPGGCSKPISKGS